ncbi:MAG: NAD-dependent epimerase/dehydratase family protein [Rhodospirillales bacterium]|nr:NAD-dependent epimerase/dehydratase family protein [Rhodospirillales bacterium]
MPEFKNVLVTGGAGYVGCALVPRLPTAGCRTIFIDHQYAEKRPEMPDFTVVSLVEAASLILSLPIDQKRLS